MSFLFFPTVLVPFPTKPFLLRIVITYFIDIPCLWAGCTKSSFQSKLKSKIDKKALQKKIIIDCGDTSSTKWRTFQASRILNTQFSSNKNFETSWADYLCAQIMRNKKYHAGILKLSLNTKANSQSCWRIVSVIVPTNKLYESRVWCK